MATMLYRKQRAEIGFAGSILTWVTRSVKIGPGRLRTQLQTLLDEDDTQSQKMLANWVFLKQPFPCNYMPWGRFKRSENGCHMNWTLGRWSDAKTHAKFCLSDKKESHSCIELWQAMKSRSIFRILNAKNLGLIPPNHQHLPQDQIERKTMLCVWWDQEGVIYYELLKPGETVNAHGYHQQLIKLHRALREKSALSEKTWQADFPILATTHHCTRQQWSKTTWRHSTGSWVLPHPAYSPDLAPSDYHLFSSMGHGAHWAALRFLRRWLDEWFASKDEEFFWRGIHKLTERWEKCIVSENKYFE